jgi:hypothetical protein
MVSRRFTALTIATGLVLAQIVAWSHAATIRHHWCAEHQDVCEGADAARTATPAPGDHTVTSGAPIDDHHERCALSRVSLTSVEPSCASPLPARAERPLAFASSYAVSIPVRALFRLAPKTSPPRAA